MVGLVLVSHSRKLTESVRDLVVQMTAPGFPVAIAGGVGDNFDELGTDAVHIADVLQSLRCPEGVLVLMDLGSAVLSAQTALELLDSAHTTPIQLCPAPLVEGAIAAAVSAQAGCSLAEVAREAERGLAAKQEQLKDDGSLTSPAFEVSQPMTAALNQSAEVELVVENQQGLHARPAAALVQTASRFASTIEISNLTSGRGPVSARSITSVALLQARKGDRIRVVCQGDDCRLALQAIRALAAAGFGESPQGSPAISTEKVPPAADPHNFPAADGIAIGPLALLQAEELAEDDEPPGDPLAELASLVAAMRSVKESVPRSGVQYDNEGSQSSTILEAQVLILDDPVVLTHVRSLIEQGGRTARRAWIEATRDLADQYERMDDPYFRERATDIRDIAGRVLLQLKGGESRSILRLPQASILFTDELLPSEAAACDPATVLGVIAVKGSATSHSAIILRTLGIPMIAGASDIAKVAPGATIAMDGSTGEIWIAPDAPTIARLERSKQAQLQLRQQAEAARTQPSISADGVRIEVLANAGNAQDAIIAATNAADGIGLLRTEFLFVSRRVAPTEDEQVQALREIYAPITGPIIVRTLDVGADKPLAFLPQPEENNPYLGARGIRLSLHSPELFLTHLRAILRSGVGHEIWLMFPMISVVEEVRQALRLLEQAHERLQDQGTAHVWPIKRGIMIEVPSAALMTEQFAEDLDFFSIGTNDLTQYTMAAERGNAAVAALQDALHPAVLRLMKSVVEGAHQRNRHVSVCGDAASDPLAAAMFAGMGIRGLSVRPNRVAETKALFRELTFSDLEKNAVRAMQSQDAAGVRNIIRHYLDSVSGAPPDALAKPATGVKKSGQYDSE